MDLYKINRLIFAVVLCCFITLTFSSVVDYLYFNDIEIKRGYSVEVAENESSSGGANAKIIEIGFLMAEANATAGEKIAMRCALCHTFKKGEPNKVGPNLWNVLNKKPALKDGFEYSNAMKSNEKIWSIEHLTAYLYAPQKIVPGTKMSFAGIKNDKELADLMSFLITLNDQKIELPPKDLKVSLP
jgi:cytochrome c